MRARVCVVGWTSFKLKRSVKTPLHYVIIKPFVTSTASLTPVLSIGRVISNKANLKPAFIGVWRFTPAICISFLFPRHHQRGKARMNQRQCLGEQNTSVLYYIAFQHISPTVEQDITVWWLIVDVNIRLVLFWEVNLLTPSSEEGGNGHDWICAEWICSDSNELAAWAAGKAEGFWVLPPRQQYFLMILNY